MSDSPRSETTAVGARRLTPPSPADLIRSNEALREDVRRLREENESLRLTLQEAERGNNQDRRSRRAALNLMEDADRARRDAQAIAEQLKRRIVEREEAEQALLESEKQLQAATERFRLLESEFDERVRKQTDEFRMREEHLGRLAAQIKRVEQKERQRLARLLHDHVQQMLVGAHLQVDLIATQLNEPQPEEFENLKTLLRDAILATRDLAVQLTPPLLHEQGLPAALEWLISRTEKEHGLKIEVEIEEEANPTTDEERDILFQAAQEFLLNAAKYAGVKEVALQLHRGPDRIQLALVDQGEGFDPAGASKLAGSFGLLQLRQRLNSVGGTLSINSRPGQGTTAAASVPISS